MPETFGKIADRRSSRCLWLLAAVAAAGCGGDKKKNYTSVSAPPTVRLTKPAARTISRTVGQPGYVQSYERTSIYPKLSAYIEKWIVDIGDRVKKGEVLATLFVPELVEEFGTKKATVERDKREVIRARKVVEVAAAELVAAKSRVVEARAEFKRYQTETDRWDSEVKRLTREVSRDVVSPQDLLQSTNRFKASASKRDAARSAIDKAAADELSRENDLAKAEADVEVANDRLSVAQSDEKRIEAWVGYLTLMAPFDGVIVARNANTFDFVLPNTGDPTAMQRAPDVSTSSAAPIYVVDRTDIVRVFIDLPERDASYVQIGSPASVMIRSFKDQEIPGKVTRTAWALNVKSRTMRVEIDLPNTEMRILPGMYVYGKLEIERAGVRALPVDAVVKGGGNNYCWLLENQKAVKTEIEVGLSDDQWIEVTHRRPPLFLDSPGTPRPWTPIDGSEQVILGDLTILSEGMTVQVENTPAATKSADTKTAGASR